MKENICPRCIIGTLIEGLCLKCGFCDGCGGDGECRI